MDRCWSCVIACVVACGGNADLPRPDAMPAPAALSSFSFLVADNPGLPHDIVATISGPTIRASTPFGGSLVGLKASFEATGASVTLDGAEQESGAVANDFTQQRTYVVTGEAGDIASYTVQVRVPELAPSTSFPVGMQPYGIALGDLDGNGMPEVVTTNLAGESVAVLRNMTPVAAQTASFGTAVEFVAATGANGVAVGDLTGDGLPDIVATGTFSHEVAVLVNTRMAGSDVLSFQRFAFATGENPHGLAIADVDANGTLDVLVASCGADAVSIFRNTTIAGASAPSFMARVDEPTAPCPTAVAAGDLDGDHIVDLVVGTMSTSSVSVLRGISGGTFASFVTVPTGRSPSSIALTDIDLDGRLDIVTSNYGSPEQQSHTLSFLVNTTTPGGAPSFTSHVTLDTVDPPHAVIATDLSGDGKPDLVVANVGSSISVLLDATSPGGVSAPRFSPRHDVTVGQGPWALAAGDLNADGRPDVAVACANSHEASVVLSR
jgi:hypothetical protein